MKDLSGQVIKGYELQKLIGTGGFGAVYQAYQTLVKREVAVKVILPDFANQPEFIRRFEAEAQLVARLEHIHIVPLYDYWREPGGAYLVMRWLRGGSLRASLEHGHWELRDAARLLDQIASALAVAHHNGVIHRDLKPDNILLDEQKNAYLADFGIAKDLENVSQASQEEDGIIGSPSYIAPEQIMTEPVTPQTDIYSLGIMLYEVLTGKTPFFGHPPSTLIFKHLQEPIPHLHERRPELPAELNFVIQRATEKNPANRYPNVLAMAADFRRAIGKTEEPSGEAIVGQTELSGLSHLGITEEFMSADLAGLAPQNPYKGLRAFQEADADDFFGREELIERLITRMKESDHSAKFLAVVGPSGSGKSSVVKAGLVPTLRKGALGDSSDWFMVEMVPGAHPLEELEAALLRVAINPPERLLSQLKEDERGLLRAVKRVLPAASAESATIGSELLLVIDQFEEVFTQVEDEAERSHFLNSLLVAVTEARGRLRVVVTLRADFYDRPLLYPKFGELVRAHTEVVLPLNNEELEKAIVEPAENAGLALEVGLVQTITNDVGERPGALPLLQYALTELFERRDGRWLTIDAYNQIGGVSGALARRADEIYAALDEASQKVARQMLLRLVTLGEGSEDTRRRVQQLELMSLQGDEQLMAAVIEKFGKYRLLTFDRDPQTRAPTVEIAHEALIRQWSLLKEWLQTNREDLRLQRRVSAATEEWVNSGKDRSFLASGTRLEQFEAWLSETELMLTDVESEYLKASLAEREKQRAEEAARLAHEVELEQRSRNRLRALVAVLTVATVGALILTIFAFSQSQIAQQNAATATVARGEALFQASTAQAAGATSDSNAAIAATQANIAQQNAATATIARGQAEVSAADARSLAFVSGSRLALSNNDTDLAILLALEANTIGQPSIDTQRVLAEAAYAPGTRLVFKGHSDRVEKVAYSPDGKWAISGSDDTTMILWDVSTGTVIRQFGVPANTDPDVGHTGIVWDVAFSPDGKTAASASADKTLILWDLETGKIIRRFGADGNGHTDEVWAVAFSPDGKAILSGALDKAVILWDVATGQIIRRFGADGGGHTDAVYDVAFSPSGLTALSASKDKTIILWSVDSGAPIATLGADGSGHTDRVYTVAYSPDESGFISGSQDNTLILWSFETMAPVRRFLGHTDRVTSVAFSPDGQRVASTSQDGNVILWDVQTAGIVHRFVGHTDRVYGVAFSPDGHHLLSAGWDKAVRLWDLDDGAQLRRFGETSQTHSAAVNGVAFSPGGKTAVSASVDNTLIVWDVASGQALRQLIGHSGAVNCIAISPDGKTAASGSDDNSVILWDIATGNVLHKFEGHGDSVMAVAFSPDGKTLASGGKDLSIILWNVQSGEQLQRLYGHTFHVTGVAFSPDGKTLVSSGRDNILILWDVATGNQIRQFKGHTDWIFGVAFSPDGQYILSGSADNTLILWEVKSGRRIRTFGGHTSYITSVAFSPDGRFAVSGSADASIIVWDVETGSEVRRFAGDHTTINSVAFSPDGQTVLSGSSDSSVRLWQVTLSLDGLKDWLKTNRYIREFTCTERVQYVIQPLCPTPTPVAQPGQSA